MSRVNKKSGLVLTTAVFKALHDSLIKALKEKYGINSDNLVDYQLYGFNYYDEKKPSIKKLIFDTTGEWVNGKYLYNKYRDWKNGTNPIRFSREFVFIYFKTIGFSDLNDFLKTSTLSELEKHEQWELEESSMFTLKNEYYVGYFEGEDGELILTKLTFSEESLKVVWTLAYWEVEEKYSEYCYKGTIFYQAHGMSFFFKNEDTMIDRCLFVAVFYERRLFIKPFLVGTYSGFDINRQPTIGEVVFQRVASEEEQIEIVNSKKIDPIIGQYIKGRRMTTAGKMPQSIYDLTVNSKVSHNILQYINTYKGVFISTDNKIYVVELIIKDESGNATLNIAGLPPYRGYFKVQTSGQMLVGQFQNSLSPSPLSLSFQSFSTNNIVFSGYLLCVTEYDKSFAGRVYLSNDAHINQHISEYKDKNLTLEEVKTLPVEILSEIKKFQKNIQDSSLLFLNESQNTQSTTIQLTGEYTFWFLDSKNHKNKGHLRLADNGQTELTIGHYVYTGRANICEGSMLSIYFQKCNDVNHCGHILGFVGRYSRDRIDWFSASWHYLDDEFKPTTKVIALQTASSLETENEIYRFLMTQNEGVNFGSNKVVTKLSL